MIIFLTHIYLEYKIKIILMIVLKFRKIVKTKFDWFIHCIKKSNQEEGVYLPKQSPWHILFDEKWYLKNNQDVAQSGIDPFEHYLEYGLKENRNPNEYFDILWYVANNEDIKLEGLNPVEHYWRYGGFEGRDPSPQFSSSGYYNLNSDVKISGLNPLEHYLVYGKNEGRLIQRSEDLPTKAFELHKRKISQLLLPYQSFYKAIQEDESFLSKILSELQFKAEESPLVSIIIPVYGKWEFTLQCLYSIYLNLPKDYTLEVIVIDDCSQDLTEKIISQVKNIQYARNLSNLGFIKSCNYGSSLARGKYLYFLNNDTVVMPGTISELLKTFENFSAVGVAGSKLIYPNGHLQEAGGIIWEDASGWNFGRNQNPCLPMYNYAREVDYCSGASIMIDRELFIRLGLFDINFTPAYYEDVDLAFKARAMGLKVIYQPLSQVIHFEGVTSGTDLSCGVKAYQLVNQINFQKKWHVELGRQLKNAENVEKAKDRYCAYRVLFVDAQILTPNADAGSLLILNMMMLFQELGFQVTFSKDGNLDDRDKHILDMQKIGIEVLYAPYALSLKDHLKECSDRYDLVILIRPDVFENNILDIKRYCPSAKVLFHTIDLHFLRILRQAEITQDIALYKVSNEMKLKEMRCIKMSDLTFVVSSEEMALLKKIDENLRVQEFSLVLDVCPSKVAYEERKDILFVGNFNHIPNRDAIHFFCTEVMPYIRQFNQPFKLHVVGFGITDEIKKLAAEDILIEGFVSDLNEKCSEVKVMVAPLRFGAGVKGKVASSLACGLPVVATRVAAEGMNLMDGSDLIVADDPKEMADAILSIYMDERIWKNLSNNGLITAERLWGRSAAIQKLRENVLSHLLLH